MEFYDNIKTLLENNEIKECSELFYSFESIQQVEDLSWELVNLFSEQIVKHEQINNNEQCLTFLRQASLYICGNFGNAKELFLVYLENADSFFVSDVNYCWLIDSLQCLLTRLATKFIFYSFELALNQLKKNLVKKSFNLKLTNKYVDFLNAFVNYKADLNMKKLLVNSIVSLFNEPLLTLDLNKDLDEQDDLVKKMLNVMNNFDSNYLNLIINLHNQTDLNQLGVGSLLYTIYNRKYNLNDKFQLPVVYEAFYELRVLLPVLNDLINQTRSQFGVEKALFIYAIILNRIPVKSLDESVLMDINDLIESIQLLFKVTVFAEHENTRKQAVDVLKLYFNRFNRQGRYAFINYFISDNLKNESLNNYVTSFLVYLFKEELNECLTNNELFYAYHVKNVKHINSNFKRTFNLITKLNTFSQNNLVQESSKVIAILNLIRFLLIKDKQNETGINELLIVSDYLNELNKSIAATKSSYSYEQHNMLNKEKSEETSSSSKMEVSTQNGIVNEMTDDEKLLSVKNAIQSIELIESLQTRCVELLNEKNYPE
jgi:hypothetical protein